MGLTGQRSSPPARLAPGTARRTALAGAFVAVLILAGAGCDRIDRLASGYGGSPRPLVSVAQLLKTYPSGSREFTAQVEGAAARKPAMAGEFVEASRFANEMQQAGIGAGLANAAQSIEDNNPGGAKQILQAIARAPKGVRIAFLATSFNSR